MEGISPRRSDDILDKPVYPTKARLISLIDICIHYLIHRPEISTSQLPSELQDHIKNRRGDDYYRVLPAYSTGHLNKINDLITEHLNRCYSTKGKDNKIKILLEMFQCADENFDSWRYLQQFSATMRKKLIDLPSEGFPIEVSRHYLLKWFDCEVES